MSPAIHGRHCHQSWTRPCRVSDSSTSPATLGGPSHCTRHAPSLLLPVFTMNARGASEGAGRDEGAPPAAMGALCQGQP